MRRYEKYKDSGIDWLGEIPEHWDLLSFRFCIDILTDYTSNGSFASLAKNVNYLEEGYSRLVRLTDLRVNLENDGIYVSESAHNFLSKSELFGGEMLIANVGAYAGLVKIMPYLDGKFTLAPNMFLLRLNQNTDFFYYQLNAPFCAEQLKMMAISSAQPKLNKDNIRQLMVLKPSFEEQKSITVYLKNRTDKIDELIVKKEQLIQLLEEERRAIINQAITKGLEPDVPLKDSGIDWLGEIPKHWEVKRTKYLFDIRKNIAGELGYDVLSVTQKGIKIKDITSGDGQLSMDYSKYQLVKKGQFVMNHMDLLTGFVDKSKYVGVTSPDYRVFESISKESESDYYLYLYQMFYNEKLLFPYGRGSAQVGRWRLPTIEFKNFRLPVPPIDEQEEIVDFIKTKHNEIDKTLSVLKKEIKYLNEYKTTLISEVVTGKIDVREVVLN